MRELVESYLRENGLVSHQIESFNDFIENRLQRIVNQVAIANDGGEKGVVETDIEGLSIWVKPWSDTKSIRIGRPEVKEADGSVRKLTPMEARLRNMTYAAPIYLTVTVIKDGVPIHHEEVEIGMLPIMVYSKACNIEKGNLEKELEMPLSDEEYHEKLIERGEDPTDPGGYFIINGSERSLVALEDLAPNEIMVEYSSRYGSAIDHW
jgi:DNA-directed RNA polymerase beta subunit